MQNPFARRRCGIRHNRQKSTTGRTMSSEEGLPQQDLKAGYRLARFEIGIGGLIEVVARGQSLRIAIANRLHQMR